MEKNLIKRIKISFNYDTIFHTIIKSYGKNRETI